MRQSCKTAVYAFRIKILKFKLTQSLRGAYQRGSVSLWNASSSSSSSSSSPVEFSSYTDGRLVLHTTGPVPTADRQVRVEAVRTGLADQGAEIPVELLQCSLLHSFQHLPAALRRVRRSLPQWSPAALQSHVHQSRLLLMIFIHQYQ